ncbi:hypothetical protein [Kitasatospora viridis]|uniref:Uncharacterized protein n=1 Tax=Kitasatospora viridis TaxID=281105 RepID=A0A561SEK0_9ACTN|nr:hypothetical protein [Kitasatospora viridis]TWF73280.1 hypothetical protein FHX73_16431 [Kitasatospora viridis]
MNIRSTVVVRAVLLGVSIGAAPALVLAALVGATLGADALGPAVAVVVLAAAVGLLPGAAMGLALAFAPRSVWDRDAHRSLVAGGAAAGAFLVQTLAVAVIGGSGAWLGVSAFGTPAVLLGGWFLSGPVAAPLRRGAAPDPGRVQPVVPATTRPDS